MRVRVRVRVSAGWLCELVAPFQLSQIVPGPWVRVRVRVMGLWSGVRVRDTVRANLRVRV